MYCQRVDSTKNIFIINSKVGLNSKLKHIQNETDIFCHLKLYLPNDHRLLPPLSQVHRVFWISIK